MPAGEAATFGWSLLPMAGPIASLALRNASIVDVRWGPYAIAAATRLGVWTLASPLAIFPMPPRRADGGSA
jgi:hypothetical protein